ncbi:hypothetical protein [Leptolyngbya sp. FACHB-16]|nr:hypothetical protein [Leptolyngbya sp. FACHB-16]
MDEEIVRHLRTGCAIAFDSWMEKRLQEFAALGSQDLEELLQPACERARNFLAKNQRCWRAIAPSAISKILTQPHGITPLRSSAFLLGMARFTHTQYTALCQYSRCVALNVTHLLY